MRLRLTGWHQWLATMAWAVNLSWTRYSPSGHGVSLSGADVEISAGFLVETRSTLIPSLPTGRPNFSDTLRVSTGLHRLSPTLLGRFPLSPPSSPCLTADSPIPHSPILTRRHILADDHSPIGATRRHSEPLRGHSDGTWSVTG